MIFNNMKARLLKRIRKNLRIIRSANGYDLRVKEGIFLDGCYRKKPVDKEGLSEAIRSLIIYTARHNYKRKGVGIY